MLLRGETLEQVFWSQFLNGLREDDRREELQSNNPFACYEGNLLGFCIEELGKSYTEDQLEVIASVERNPVTVARAANGVGKTDVAADLCVAYFLTYSDAQVVTFCAPPEENLKLILWGEIGEIIETKPRLFDQCGRVSLPGMLIRRNSRSYLTGLAIPQAANPDAIKARFSGKHSPRQLFVGDEGDGVPKAILDAIEGCMSSDDARELLLFNPRNPSGPLHRMERNEEAAFVHMSSFNHPNVLSGRDIIPGAVTRERTVWRINKWTRPLAVNEKRDSECFEVPSFLAGHVAKERNKEQTPMPPLKAGPRRILEPSFSHVVLGEYPSASTFQLIAHSWVQEAFSRYRMYQAEYGDKPPTGVRSILGVDVADIQGKDRSVLTARFGSWVGRQHVWEGMDPVQVGESAMSLYRIYNALKSNNDGTGVGAGSIRPMRREGAKAHRIMASAKTGASAHDIGVFSNVRTEMLWYVRLWLKEDPYAALHPDPELEEELIAPKYWINVRGEIQITDTTALTDLLSRSPDKLMSLGFTFAPEPEDDDNEPGEFAIDSYIHDNPSGGSFSVRVGAGR